MARPAANLSRDSNEREREKIHTQNVNGREFDARVCNKQVIEFSEH